MELHVEGAVAGVRVQGIVDLMGTEGRSIDCKSAARRPAGITPEYGLELHCSMLTSMCSVTIGSRVLFLGSTHPVPIPVDYRELDRVSLRLSGSAPFALLAVSAVNRMQIGGVQINPREWWDEH